jgi:hypothetical protein
MGSPDYIVDIQGLGAPARDATSSASLKGRPWLAISWKCCSVYSRVYRNKQATAYEGRCPKCSRQLKVPIGEGGTSNRFFEAE